MNDKTKMRFSIHVFQSLVFCIACSYARCLRVEYGAWDVCVDDV